MNPSTHTARRDRTPFPYTQIFVDPETGVSMDYNLFIPVNYDSSKRYPFVLFMMDASTAGKGVVTPLKEGYGGIIWATEESQRELLFCACPLLQGTTECN